VSGDPFGDDPYNTGYQYLSDEALGDRLRRTITQPERWDVLRRQALILEAARRLDQKPLEVWA
jgi:hypothetical protein